MHTNFRLLIRPIQFAILALGLILPVLVHGQASDDKPAAAVKTDRAKIIAEMELTKEQADAIQIQMDAQGPIFVLGTTGGLRVRPDNDGAPPLVPKLQVFADGKLVVSGGLGVPDMESKFTESELIAFLNFVVNTNQFFAIDSEDIRKRIQGKEKVQIMDASSTVFIADLQKGKNEVQVYALWNAIRNFPEFDEIKRLSAIEKRCNSIINQAHLGDGESEVLKLVNEKLEGLDLGLASFTIEEMRLAHRGPNGRFQVSFERKLPGAKAKRIAPSTIHAVYFKKNTETEATVSFFGLPKK